MNYINRDIMKRIFFTVLFFAMQLTTATAQDFPVDTARLNNAYRTLEKGIRTTQTEMEFLEAYPTTWLEFYMTYSCLYNENNNYSMCDMCSEHISRLFGLSHINNQILCKKIINLAIGMKDSGECTEVFQNYLINYISSNEKLILEYLSTLRKGHQMEFWQFCWSSTTECNWTEHFSRIYIRNKDKYPEEMEISRIAFQFFYNGINFPTLFPHKEEEYERKYNNKNYKQIFNDYTDFGEE